MRKYEKRQILKNVGSSWSALAVNVLVGIFLSPFILHRLGDVAFGIWVLIFSVTGYYGLFDLGIRSSIIRYVSKYTATGESGKLACFVNTSLFTYTVIGVVSMVLTTVLSSYVGGLFRIPPEMHRQAHILLLLVGAVGQPGISVGRFRRHAGRLATVLHSELDEHRLDLAAGGADRAFPESRLWADHGRTDYGRACPSCLQFCAASSSSACARCRSVCAT